jgi:hypothetical protein
MNLRWIVAACVLAGGLTAGCGSSLKFPAQSMSEAAKSAAAVGAYDTNGDGKADFFTFAGPDGRITRIGYAAGKDERADTVVDLDAIPFEKCRHVVLILDGFGYDVVRRYYEGGGLRVCCAPSRVIAPYPTLTDLSLEDLLGYVPCRAFEAMYFDRQNNRVAGGNDDYLKGLNEPYNQLLQYRASSIWDAIGYLYPEAVFRRELSMCKDAFDHTQTREFLAYFVSSAGVSTSFAEAGQVRALQQVDRLILALLWESRGRVKFTVTADHGHSYTHSTRIPLEKHLESRGWRVRDSLEKPKDVAYIRYGLETYCGFATNQPAELASDLTGCEGVDLVSYADKDSAVVLTPGGGKAVIRQKNGRFKYEPLRGDPLKLKDILAKLQADGEGYYGEPALLNATVTHDYPDPLERVWRAHFAQAKNPLDVIVSLKDNYFSGSADLAKFVDVASTHGSLNLRNSSTFIMTSMGPLPPFMRSAGAPEAMTRLIGQPWPMKK